MNKLILCLLDGSQTFFNNEPHLGEGSPGVQDKGRGRGENLHGPDRQSLGLFKQNYKFVEN